MTTLTECQLSVIRFNKIKATANVIAAAILYGTVRGIKVDGIVETTMHEMLDSWGEDAVLEAAEMALSIIKDFYEKCEVESHESD